jgi:ABC-type transport system involved in multi-copper enzyme maturation permease subunit
MTALIVARGTLMEALRDRVLYLPVVFVLFILIGSAFLGTLSLGEMDRLAVDFGLAGITFFVLLTAVFLGIGWSYQGVTRRTAYALLARPVSRRSILWGAFLGLGAVQIIGLLVMALSWRGILSLIGVSWSQTLTLSMFLLGVESLLVTALAVFLSTLASPAVAGATAVVLLLAGYGSRSLRDLTAGLPDGAFHRLAELGYYVIPCLSSFSPSELGYPANVSPGGEWWWAVAYGVSYAMALLAVSAAIFSRREIY